MDTFLNSTDLSHLSMHSGAQKWLTPTRENQHKTISQCLQTRKFAAIFLLTLYTLWAIIGYFYSTYSIFMLNTLSILLLVAILFISGTNDRVIQKKIRLISKILVLKSMIGSVLVLYILSQHLDTENNWKEREGVSSIVMTMLELLGFIVGVFVAKQTKRILQIVGLDFSEKYWSNYVEITEEKI